MTRTDPAHLASLLEASSRGDEAAFAALYDVTSGRVHGLVLRILRDQAQSEEVVQEVFLQLWQTSTRFDPARGTALSWIMTHAHRKAVDRVRSSQSGRVRDTAHVDRSAEIAYDETAAGAEASLEAAAVRAALVVLSPDQRRAVELAYFGGYTHAEVSRLTQVPLGTAKTRIRSGLLRLRDALSPLAVETA